MKCIRCGNQDAQYFTYDPFHKTWYCRKCIAFGRIDVGERLATRTLQKLRVPSCNYTLKYPLSAPQQKAMREILYHLQHKQDVLVYAACGAGKTELVMESIKTYLNAGKKVCFAISRRQVVLEIRERMAEAFPMLQVIAVCEGYTEVVDGDLIICTMHQLYRYPHAFDLLIMDEVDAFPYRGNELLETIAQSACKGEKLFLSATPEEAMLEAAKAHKIALVELFQRPHGHPLIVPKVIAIWPSIQLLLVYVLLYRWIKEKIQVLLFVPTIREAHHTARLLRPFFRCATFTSKTEEKEAIIDAFHAHHYDVLVATTILERGITIKGIYIIILHADHAVFNEASLIQMIGRVGRNIHQPTGEGVFLCTKKTRDIQRCIRALIKMNETLPARATTRLPI